MGRQDSSGEPRCGRGAAAGGHARGGGLGVDVSEVFREEWGRSVAAIARATGDPVLLFEAQRHLGDHAHDDGDPVGARERWEESTAAGGRARHIGGTLAQQLLLAVLHRDEGDEAGARAIAGEVLRWASAIGAAGAARQAEAFLAGVDPTKAPEED